MDSFRRASVCASAAFCTHVGVDVIDVTLRDSPNRAFVDASAASNAIVTNYVSHFRLILSLVLNVAAKLHVLLNNCCAFCANWGNLDWI